jgi:hypothetical protein
LEYTRRVSHDWDILAPESIPMNRTPDVVIPFTLAVKLKKSYSLIPQIQVLEIRDRHGKSRTLRNVWFDTAAQLTTIPQSIAVALDLEFDTNDIIGLGGAAGHNEVEVWRNPFQIRFPGLGEYTVRGVVNPYRQEPALLALQDVFLKFDFESIRPFGHPDCPLGGLALYWRG